MKHTSFLTCNLLLFFSFSAFSQTTATWQLWAQGLPQGAYPRMAVAPDHSIYYTLLGAPGSPAVIYRAGDTRLSSGNFQALPAVPVPMSLQNNITALEISQLNAPIAGIYRSNSSDPWVFIFNAGTQTWEIVQTDINPNLGASCMARSLDGTLWLGAKWSYVYKSVDDGHTFSHIDESALVGASAPCYYPSWVGNDQDGAIFGINVDKNGRVYVGTETAGIVYSDDNGMTWQPADYHPCQDTAPTQKDNESAMHALTIGGNCAGIGFTADNKLIWSGADMWTLGWPNKVGLADMQQHTVTPCTGFPQYLVTTGQQVSKIVTASNGQVFLHSGGNNMSTGVGIYTSMDGEQWSVFNTGITGLNDGLSQGSLTVDSNLVFMATHDGKVWRYVIADSSSATATPEILGSSVSIWPNPARSTVRIDLPEKTGRPATVTLFDGGGKPVLQQVFTQQPFELDISRLSAGFYQVSVLQDGRFWRGKVVVL